ncbi:MAG: OmpA family protein [Pseudomonadota bacterium]|nr:OmpA family protein [Pseudomonadota bacterium]
MKTKLLPLVAIISMVAMAPAQAADISTNGTTAYAVDGSGNIVRDSYGSCVRSIDWTKDTAIAACETPAPAAKAVAAPAAKAAPTAVMAPAAVNTDIKGNDQFAYAVDSDGDIVRDAFGGCVRTIDWTKETAIAKCEGWEEPKPAPAPVVAPAPAPKPAPVAEVKEDAPAAFRGFFDTDMAVLKPVATEELDVYSGYMARNPDKNVKVTGHTDATGSEAYNQALSERRAAAVKIYLEGKGIDGKRIEAKGMGESQPVADNSTKEGRAQNRRVELEIIK